ncbi:MAG TPA: UvrD-helicase domain-containing protein [Chlamydiales bacterium]|nr:UvrD-helicase domain-containing protein [Chlamydiales bacterium]
MQPFNCLALDCPLFGPHLLEASAGTGKTFSIEHIFVRLVLESIEVEQILAVTFTRAATRELKARIRANLEKALHFIRESEPAWEYLQPYLGSEEAIRNLSDALAGFERCQIFTIHGFCYRILSEFAFEAKMGPLSNPDEGKKIPERLRKAASDFLASGIDESLLCAEQIAQLTKQFESVEELTDRLLRLEKPEANASFSTLFAKCKAALHLKVDASKLLEDFYALEKNYKVEVKGNFAPQVSALAQLDDPASFRVLLRGRGSLFDFLDPANRKVRAKEPPFLHYPGFFDWARTHIAPLVRQKVLPTLQAAWNPIAEKILSEEEYLDPDGILARMKKAIENESLRERVRQKYAAAIIDEFQDTDAVQWDIFQSLFLEGNLRALYLVGDPKQSIYRFRKADVYTYLKARDFLGEERTYQLDTNFRSSKSLISALNALFARDWLHLPKVNRTLPCHPVKAGADVDSTFPDEKGALHFFVAEGDSLFDEVFLPYAVREIERLDLKKCAILVKDRYQAEKALDLCKSRGIAAIAKSHTPLGETVAFQAIRELFEAILSPRDASAAKIVMAGPFSSPEIPFADYKVLLEEKGLVPFARSFLKPPVSPDAMQIFEMLFAWEKQEGFSFEGLKRYLKVLKNLKAEEGGRRRMEVDEEAVQIMTLHISKGLEFDVVFALGLASRTPEADEEIAELDAEKQRQLYVAMTRAKKRLYVPIALSKRDPAPGAHSPMELFCRHLGIDQLTSLSKTESITLEHLSSPLILDPSVAVKPDLEMPSSPPPPIPYQLSFLSSFTTLAKTSEVKWSEQKTEGFTLQSMPRGTETGIAIHQIFETLFSHSKPVWRDPKAIDALVEEELRFSPLAPWNHAIQKMVQSIITLPLQADGEFFSLSELEPNQLQVEMEFLFSTPPHFVKGFIDLVICHRAKVYFLDWKTNWLEDYTPSSLHAAMQAHDYALQASLYAEAIRRHFKMPYGGAFYLFVRGGVSLFI